MDMDGLLYTLTGFIMACHIGVMYKLPTKFNEVVKVTFWIFGPLGISLISFSLGQFLVVKKMQPILTASQTAVLDSYIIGYFPSLFALVICFIGGSLCLLVMTIYADKLKSD